MSGNGGMTAWCSTQTNTKGEHIEGNEEECSDDCPVSRCPIGFYWAAAEGTCYQASHENNQLVYVQSTYF